MVVCTIITKVVWTFIKFNEVIKSLLKKIALYISFVFLGN